MEKSFRYTALGIAIALMAIGLEPWAMTFPGVEYYRRTATAPWADIWASLSLIQGSVYFPWVVSLAAGMSIGAWTGWVLQKLDRKPGVKSDVTPVLAEDMRDMITRMRRVSEACHTSEFQISFMVEVYTDFQALQLSLQRAGLKVPWKHWEPGEDPLPYLTTNLGYLAFVEPFMRKGHLLAAIRSTRKSLDLKRSPRGPVLRMGVALKRLI